MKRLAGLAAALAVLAAGCAPATRAPEELRFRVLAAGPELAAALRGFEAENPGFRVVVEPLPAAHAADTIAAALAAGAPPDLCELDGRDVPRFMAAGELVDWSAGVADQRDSLRGWELCRVGDAIYGLPWRLSATLLWCNLDLFAAAGLGEQPLPATWEQLVSAANRVQRLGHGVRGLGLALADSQASWPAFAGFARGAGGGLLSAELDSSRFATPGNVAALELFVRLRRAALLAPDSVLAAEFAAGRLGMRLASARDAAPDLARRCRFVLPPAPASRADSAACLGDGEVLVSFVHARRKEAALRLARYLVRPDVARSLAAGDTCAVRPHVAADSLGWYSARPRELAIARALARAAWPPMHPAWSDMRRALERELGLALLGARDAAAAAANADSELTRLTRRRSPSDTAAETTSGGGR